MSRKGKQVWVSPNGEQWKIHRPGNKRASGLTENKKEAIQLARKLAISAHAELIVQNEDGKIGYKNSYGPDDFPPRG